MTIFNDSKILNFLTFKTIFNDAKKSADDEMEDTYYIGVRRATSMVSECSRSWNSLNTRSMNNSKRKRVVLERMKPLSQRKGAGGGLRRS